MTQRPREPRIAHVDTVEGGGNATGFSAGRSCAGNHALSGNQERPGDALSGVQFGRSILHMSGRFSEQLRRKVDAVWEAEHRHPFVRGIGDSTLEPERFQTWLCQDYLFLVDFTRVLGLAAARAADVETMKWMIDMAHAVLHGEMLLHQAYAVELGLTLEALQNSAKLPTTRAYTDHLLRTGGMAGCIELIAAVLPCAWGHVEIGQRLTRGTASPARRYGRWIDIYSGPAAAGLARRGRDLLDRLAEASDPGTLTLAEETFAVSSRYEWMFWQMCWLGESWPV
jgi:thiaminase (transcriptional activator TenA)